MYSQIEKFEGQPFIAQHHPHTWRLLHEAFRLKSADAATLLSIEPDEVQQLLGGQSSPSPELFERSLAVYGVAMFQGVGLPSERPVWELCPRGLQIAAAGVRMNAPRLADEVGLSAGFVRELLAGRKREITAPHREALGAVLGVTLFQR